VSKPAYITKDIVKEKRGRFRVVVPTRKDAKLHQFGSQIQPATVVIGDGESPERQLLRDFLADMMGTTLLGNTTWTGKIWVYDDAVQATASYSDLVLIKRARRLLRLKPLVLQMGDKPDWFDRACEIGRAWAYGKTIARDGTIK